MGDVNKRPPGGGATLTLEFCGEVSRVEWYPDSTAVRNALQKVADQYGVEMSGNGFGVDLTPPNTSYSSRAYVTRYDD